MNQNEKAGENTNEFKTIFFKDGWVAVFSAGSAALLAIFSFAAYWFDVSYLNFWDISRDFIHSDSRNLLYNIIAAVCVSAVTMFIAHYANSIYIQIKSVWGKIVFFVIAYIISFIFSCILSTLWLISSTKVLLGYWDAFIIWSGDPAYRVLIFVFASILTFPVFVSLLFSIISVIRRFFRRKKSNNSKCSSNQDKEKKAKRTPEEKYKLFMSSMFLFLAVAFVFLCFAMYNSLIEQYKNTTTFDIIDNQYVVLYKDTDTFVVKNCCVHEGEAIYIDSDAYRLMDAKGVDVQTIHFTREGNDPVFYRLSSEEYAEHLASESPAHETSG